MIAGPCGNLSARARSGNTLYITPRSANKARLTVSDICRISLDPTPQALDAVSVEFPMHRACYEADDDIGAVIHTHGPALTAAGIRRLDLGELLPEAATTLGGIRQLPYRRSGSRAMGDAVGRAVADGAGLMLLERHGAVAVGRDLAEAYDRMEFAELSAKAALLALGERPCVSR